MCTWEFLPAVSDKGKDIQMVQSSVLSVSCPQAASLQLASKVYPAAQEDRRLCLVCSTVQTCTCVELLRGSLTPPCTMVFWTGSLHMYTYMYISVCFFLFTCEKFLSCSKVNGCIIFKPTNIQNLHVYCKHCFVHVSVPIKLELGRKSGL